VLEVAKMLKLHKYEFHINIIGIGEEKTKLKQLLNIYQINHEVDFLGSMSPEKVREYMKMANIFLFTSDYEEGWGAVLNEAMNSCCAVIACHAAGSVPYLIKHNNNGLIFETGNVDKLYKYTKYLMDNTSECERLGVNAYNTMKNIWNAERASSNFLILGENILSNRQLNINVGPCSIANVINPKHIYKELINKTQF
jgi:glycosyltransferase involved in cell wall biosynthesis